MEDWEFLIQREGDREWRPIKTGNLQLMEGTYRIVANSNLFDTEIHTRVTHQTLSSTVPQRQAQSRSQVTNARGLLIMIPFTQLQAGLWQFVCSGNHADQTAWHRILKLKVLSQSIDRSIRTHSQIDPVSSLEMGGNQTQIATIPTSQIDRIEANEDLITPTAPLIPLTINGEQGGWVDGLDRLLEQLERDSLGPQPQQTSIGTTRPNLIQINPIGEPPSQLIHLNRSTFSDVTPGSRLAINGVCNLLLIDATLVQTVKIDKISLCLRHPQTAETIFSIEQSLPPYLDTFGFSCHIEVPIEPKISLLLGEVNLYDRHNIQLGCGNFTISVNLNPVKAAELSLFQLFDAPPATLPERNPYASEGLLTPLDRDLQLETFAPQPPSSQRDRSFTPSTIEPLTARYPTVPAAYKRESVLANRPDIVTVQTSATSQPEEIHTIDRSDSIPPQQPDPAQSIVAIVADITGDLEIDFQPNFISVASRSVHRPHDPRNFDTLEIVVDD